MLKRASARYLALAVLLSTASLLRMLRAGNAGGDDDPICANVGASLGVFIGESLTTLQPLDLLGVQGPAAWPVSNPVFTAGGLKSYDGIHGLRLWPYNGRLYMFHEATSCRAGRRSIGIAESLDDGITWRGLGTVLSTQSRDALRRPALFDYEGTTYMAADSDEGPKLYRCTRFPMGWHYNHTLVDVPLRGVSIFKAPGSKMGLLEKWVMLGSVPARSAARVTPVNGGGVDEDDVMAVYIAPTPLGPWTAHTHSPFGVRAASPGGGLMHLPDGRVVRLGRTCRRGTCGDVQARRFSFGIGVPTESDFDDMLGPRIWRQGRGWDGGERNGAALAANPSGKITVAVVGMPERYKLPTIVVWLQAVEKGATWVAAGAAAALVSVWAARRLRRRALEGVSGHAASPWMATPAVKGNGSAAGSPPLPPSSAMVTPAIHRLQAEERGESMTPRVRSRGLTVRRGGVGLTPTGSPKYSAAAAVSHPTPFTPGYAADEEKGLIMSHHHHFSLSPHPHSAAATRRRRAVAAAGATLRRGLTYLADVSSRQLRLIFASLLFSGPLSVALNRGLEMGSPFWSPTPALSVGGQFSRFTLLVASTPERRALLDPFIAHYHVCPSVGEILIVWAGAAPPDPAVDFTWAAAPVRVRLESNTSRNAVYRPDPALRFRGVLILEDTARIPCGDVERGFAVWRAGPNTLAGYQPRLAEAATTPRYQTEPEAVGKGWYNLILSSAAFIDSRAAFSNYWAPERAPERALVDELGACDDLLLNFVVAAAAAGQRYAAVAFVRPTRRADATWWRRGVQLARDEAGARSAAEQCLVAFEKGFGAWPLKGEDFDWSAPGRGRPRCPRRKSGATQCTYLSG